MMHSRLPSIHGTATALVASFIILVAPFPREASAIPSADLLKIGEMGHHLNLWAADFSHSTGGNEQFHYETFRQGEEPFYAGVRYSNIFHNPDVGNSIYFGSFDIYGGYEFRPDTTLYFNFNHTEGDDSFSPSSSIDTDWDLKANNIRAGVNFVRDDWNYALEVGAGCSDTETDIDAFGFSLNGRGATESHYYTIGGRISRTFSFGEQTPIAQGLRSVQDLELEPYVTAEYRHFTTDDTDIDGFTGDIDYEDSDAFLLSVGALLRCDSICPLTNRRASNFAYTKVSGYFIEDSKITADSGGAPPFGVSQNTQDNGGYSFSAGLGSSIELGPNTDLEIGYSFSRFWGDSNATDSYEHVVGIGIKGRF